MLIDTHCHINCLGDYEIKELAQVANHRFIDSSTNYSSSLISLSLSQKYPFVYSSLGFHPFWAKEFSPHTLKDYQKLIEKNTKVIAIGEVGLDENANISQKVQEEIFEKFLALAKLKNLPLILHNRFEPSRILEVLDRNMTSYKKVIFHCFSYSQNLLEKIVAKNGYICFSLNILRKKDELIKALKACPLKNMLLETDSPYMKIKGRPANPLDINEVYSFVALAKGIDEKELQNTVFLNAKRIFAF